MASAPPLNEDAGPLPPKQSPPHQLTDQTILITTSRGKLPSDSLLDAGYRCCCGTFHVERGAYWIAVVGLVMCALSLFPSILLSSWSSVVSLVISVLIYVGIIVAQRKQQPQWYLPYLILNGIGIVLIPLYIILCAVAMVYMSEFFHQLVKPDDYKPYTEEQVIFGARIILGVAIVAMAISEALSIWFESVVYRAYKFMKMSVHSHHEITYA